MANGEKCTQLEDLKTWGIGMNGTLVKKGV